MISSARTVDYIDHESLSGGGWEYPTNSLHRFFKVKVAMP